MKGTEKNIKNRLIFFQKKVFFKATGAFLAQSDLKRDMS